MTSQKLQFRNPADFLKYKVRKSYHDGLPEINYSFEIESWGRLLETNQFGNPEDFLKWIHIGNPEGFLKLIQLSASPESVSKTKQSGIADDFLKFRNPVDVLK